MKELTSTLKPALFAITLAILGLSMLPERAAAGPGDGWIVCNGDPNKICFFDEVDGHLVPFIGGAEAVVIEL